MSLSLVISEENYLKSYAVFRRKTLQNELNQQMLLSRLPQLSFKQKKIPGCQELNVLSVGTSDGVMDLLILKLIKEKLAKTDLGCNVKIFNRAIEPNASACDLYRAAIENLPNPLNDGKTAFEICQQTFEEYQESQKKPMKFDIIHFIHSIYFNDVEKALRHCYETEIGEKGYIICIATRRDLMFKVALKQRLQSGVYGDGTHDVVEKIVEVANKNGWKYEVDHHDSSYDVTEVFDPTSTEGNRLLDFMTVTANFREMADPQLVEETLALIKDLSVVRDGKHFAEKKDSLVIIHKN